MDVDPTLLGLLSDVTSATTHRYDVRDDTGRPLDCLKVQQAGPGSYLGVSHAEERGAFNVYLSSSTDLLEWTSVRRLGDDASQPTLEPDGGDGWLYADEVMDAKEGNSLRFRHYPSTDALVHGEPDREFAPPNTLAKRGSAQGTPHVTPTDPPFSADRSKIRVGFHYFANRDLKPKAC